MKPFITKIKSVCLMVLLLFITVQSYAVGYDKIVAKDGSGDYLTVEAAIAAADVSGKSGTDPYRIFIKSGIYYENLTITKQYIQLIGEDVAKTIITYNNYNGKAMPGGGSYGTANSASVIVNGNDFSAANITFENSTGDSPQALAINVSGDRASFKNCRFLGGQDTFLSYNSKYPQSLYKCYIEGVVDFIFGNAKTVFDECTIYARDRTDNNGSYITASNTRESKGFLFRNCEIIENRGTTKYVLGRPWQNDAATTTDKSTAATVFVNTKMSSVVKPEGWATWDAGTDVSKVIYAEYNSMNMDGTPLDVSSRVSWSKQLNSIEVAEYLDNNIVFKDRNDNVWNPYAMFLDGNSVPTNRLAISNFKYKKSGTELTFTWNLNWPEGNVTYKLYRVKDGGAPVEVNTQVVASNDVNVSYAPTTGKETVPPSMSTYEYYVEATSANGTVLSESATIAAIPTFKLTGTLQNFKQGNDKASAPQIFTLEGEYLQENATVTPPANFEVSADNGTTWATVSSPLVLPVTSGLLTSKTILVRLNAGSPSTYSGNLTIISGTGSHNITVAVSGETYDHPIFNSKVIASIALTDATKNTGSTYLKVGLSAASLNLGSYVLSDKVSGLNAPYTREYGIQFGPNASGGGWGVNEIKNMTDKTKYVEISLTSSSTYQTRVDSILFDLAVFQTTGNFAIEYSTDNFATSTLLKSGLLSNMPLTPNGTYSNFPDGTWALLKQGSGANLNHYAFALNAANGANVAPGNNLKVRFYFRTGSSSNDRYITLKNIDFKGSVGLAAVEGDYKTVSSGSWLDNSIWNQLQGGTWVSATTPPHYGTGHISFIENGHIVTAPNQSDLNSAYSNSYGYVNSLVVREGGKLIVESGKALNLHREQLYQIDGEFENNGAVNNDGKLDLTINGTVTNNGTLKVDQAGSNVYLKGRLINKSSVNYNFVTVKDGGVYEHAANSNTMPATITFEEGSTFLISGITSSQTGILKNTISYYNVVWDNAGQTKYYAFQGNLVENVRGKFTVNNTGTQYLALLNNTGTIGWGSYQQNGGRVVVRENGTVDATINLSGDFTVNGGTFESNSAVSVTINLNGANSKYSYNDATNTLTNLAVGVSGDYTLQSPLNVNALALSGTGKMTLGNNTLTASSVTGGTSSAYIVTNGTGKLKIKNVGASNVVFPIGASATSYSPVTISNAGTADNFAVNVQNTFDAALPTPSKAVKKQWNIAEDVDGGSNAIVTLSWLTADQGAGFDPAGSVSLLSYNGTNWAETASTISGDGTSGIPYMSTKLGITAFGVFGVGNPEALPLQLLNFKAKVLKNISPTVQLDWATTNEINTLKFEVERSIDGKNFQSIGTVISKNVAGVHNYNFSDENPSAGIAYYRLKQIDLNGTFTYSEPQAINNEEGLVFTIYPNPVADVLTVNHAKAKQNSFIKVLSLDGKVMATVKAETGSFKTVANLATLTSGVYLIRFNNGSNNSVSKFIKL
ncbi:MAG TPA: pectinesterase family protein [Pelobium sp.]|nr:pectinesterase family protein [Pelobium sp.]